MATKLARAVRNFPALYGKYFQDLNNNNKKTSALEKVAVAIRSRSSKKIDLNC